MQLTVRGINEKLSSTIRRLAREEDISLNKAALKLLGKGAGIDQGNHEKTIGSDLDHLFGTWEPAEADDFLRSIRSCRQIDEAFWQ